MHPGWKAARIVMAAALIAISSCAQKDSAKIPAACTGRAADSIGGPFSLIDQEGRAVTEAAFQDKPSLFFFGYTYCPDVCPLTLSRLKDAYDILGPDAAKAYTVFITVDPERDTPEAMKAYLENPAFPAGTIGLSGSTIEVEKALSAFKVASKVDKGQNNQNKYEVSHSSLLYLMTNYPNKTANSGANNWRLAAFLPDSTPPQDIAACVRAAIDGKL